MICNVGDRKIVRSIGRGEGGAGANLRVVGVVVEVVPVTFSPVGSVVVPVVALAVVPLVPPSLRWRPWLAAGRGRLAGRLAGLKDLVAVALLLCSLSWRPRLAAGRGRLAGWLAGLKGSGGSDISTLLLDLAADVVGSVTSNFGACAPRSTEVIAIGAHGRAMGAGVGCRGGDGGRDGRGRGGRQQRPKDAVAVAAALAGRSG